MFHLMRMDIEPGRWMKPLRNELHKLNLIVEDTI
jgi:hypothetical protein